MSAAAFQFPEVGEWPKPAISKTRINTYRQCPWRFDAQYVSRLTREFVLAAEIFGRAMHGAAAFFYRAVQQGATVSRADVVDEFATSWNTEIEQAAAPLRYAEGYDRHAMSGLGGELLEIFLRDVRPRQILAVEQRFAVPLGAQTLIGILDLVEADADGEPIVVELKTAPGRMSDRQAKEQLDGRIYAFALKQLGLLSANDDALVRYDVLIKRKRPAMSSTYDVQSADRVASFAAWLEPVIEGIRRGRFYRRSGWYCAHCPFQSACQGKQSFSLPARGRQSLAGSGAPSINPAVCLRIGAAPGSFANGAASVRRPS